MVVSNKGRMIMLAVSGTLFGASAFGWWIHTQQSASTPPVVTSAATPSVVTTTPVSVAVQSSSQAPAVAPVTLTEPTKEVFVATKMEDAIREARGSIRRDPLAPLNVANSFGNHYQESLQIPVPPPMRLIDPPKVNDESIKNLPPPPWPTGPIVRDEPKHDKLLVSDFRLVGTIDGKGIFRIRRDVASNLALPTSFTLGRGESFANIKLQKIDPEQAVVSDGTEVATKELGQIH